MVKDISLFKKRYIGSTITYMSRSTNFKSNEKYYNYTEETAIITKCAPPYAWLLVGYKKKTKLIY